MIVGMFYFVLNMFGEGDELMFVVVLFVVVQVCVGMFGYYIGENVKMICVFLKKIGMMWLIQEIEISELNVNMLVGVIDWLFVLVLVGVDVGFVLEVGCLVVVDFGVLLVCCVYECGVKVVLFVGLSLILFVLMVLGLNGQSFVFNGYLLVDVVVCVKCLCEFE